MDVLITATLACALAALFGGFALLRLRDRPGPVRTDGAVPPAGRPETPMGRLKHAIRARDWPRALPPLLVVGGILGFMLFGSLVILFVFDLPRSGWPMLVLAALTIAWVVREYVRA